LQVKLLKNSIEILGSGQVIFSISHPSKPSTLSLSQKPTITLTRPGFTSPLGIVRSHSFASTNVDLTINQRETAIKAGGLMSGYWTFTSASPLGSLYWSIETEDIDGEGLAMLVLSEGEEGYGAETLILTDAKKHGQTLARMAGDVLTFEMAGLSQALMDEVMVSAVGMLEIMKKREIGTEVIKAVAGVS
jgi:hypothetical protein